MFDGHSDLLFEDNISPNDISRHDPGRYDHYEELDYPQRCHRLKWSYEMRPTCHAFHELSLARSSSPYSLQDWHYNYLAHGHYRDTWMFSPIAAFGNHHNFVLKSLRLAERRNFTAFEMSQIQLEALSMLRTIQSKRTFGIYGHCGTSVLVQAGTPIDKYLLPHLDLYDPWRLAAMQKDDVYPMNMVTTEQKLYITLAMAEGLATLHGHEEGVIVNDDVQVQQFLVAPDESGRLYLRLNDFNNARVLKWKRDNTRYCSFRSHFDWVNRPPEEIRKSHVDETADVYAFGNIMYTILTGLLPYHDYATWDDAVEALKNGIKPTIDPRYRTRSLIESRLVEIMEPCWAYKRSDRISIFDVVVHLRETRRQYEAQMNRTLNESDLLKELIDMAQDDGKSWNRRYEHYYRSTRHNSRRARREL